MYYKILLWHSFYFYFCHISSLFTNQIPSSQRRGGKCKDRRHFSLGWFPSTSLEVTLYKFGAGTRKVSEIIFAFKKQSYFGWMRSLSHFYGNFPLFPELHTHSVSSPYLFLLRNPLLCLDYPYYCEIIFLHPKLFFSVTFHLLFFIFSLNFNTEVCSLSHRFLLFIFIYLRVLSSDLVNLSTFIAAL